MSSTNTNGVVEWSNTGSNFSGSKEKTEFLRLKDGSNIIRVITSPYQYHIHNFENVGGRQFMKVKCSRSKTEERCPYCESGSKSKKRFYLGVIDKSLGMTKILDISSVVSDQILNYVSDADWGAPNESGVFEYDFDLLNKKQNSPLTRYTIAPKPRKSLTAAEIVMAESFDLTSLDRLSTPPTYEQALAKFKELGLETKETSTATTEVEDDGSFFTNYDSKKAAS